MVVIPSTGKGHLRDHIRSSEVDMAHLDHAWVGGEICKVMLSVLETGLKPDQFWIKVRLEDC